MQNDHYKTLGVMDTAEYAVIKAAYKALMQIYHPDRYSNEHERAETTNKAQKINDAYRILSNPQLRKEYDEQRVSQKNEYEPDSNNVTEERNKNDVLEESWEIAKQFVEGIDEIDANLLILSPELSFTFKLSVLESKRFDEASEIAEELERSYLEKYFGKNKEVHTFVKWLLHNKMRNIALEVNKAVNVLGSKFDENQIINKLITKYRLEYERKKSADAAKGDDVWTKGERTDEKINKLDVAIHFLVFIVFLILLAYFLNSAKYLIF